MIFASKNLRHQPYNNQCLNPKYQDVLLSGQDQKLLHRKPFGFKKLLKKSYLFVPKIGHSYSPYRGARNMPKREISSKAFKQL
jgi:hypothetical protein